MEKRIEDQINHRFCDQVIEDFYPEVAAIYLGGSCVDPVIDEKGDIDYIVFTTKRSNFQRILNEYFFKGKFKRNDIYSPHHSQLLRVEYQINIPDDGDYSQIRDIRYKEKINWFSYFDVLMIKVSGEDVCPKTDVIHEHRKEFIQALAEKMDDLNTGKMKNQKRWYHILRGAYILINKSYEVTPEQKEEINKLHDMEDDDDLIKIKTIKLINDLKAELDEEACA